MRLGLRFTLLITSAIAFTGAVLIAGFLRVERRFLIEEGQKSQQTNTEHLAHLCAEALVTHDELGLVNFLKELGRSPDLEEAFCVDRKGKVLAHTDLALLGRTLTAFSFPWTAMGQPGPNSSEWIYSQVATRNEKSEVLARVVYDSSGIKKVVSDRLSSLVRRSLGLGGGVLGLALLLAWGTARALTRPLRRLAQGVRRVGGGDWTARVSDDAPGEIGELAREFNTMSNRLGELDRLKDQFINNVSHDLRNPLSAIATSAKMLRTDDLPPPSFPLLRVIEVSAIRLRTMVNNILDTAKMREGRLVYEKSVFHPKKLFEDLAALFAPLAKKSGKELTLNLSADLPALYADEEKVLRVFLNLLSNAFKFTKEGDRVSLSGRVVGAWVEFQVEDTGWGIGSDRMAHLFEAFHSTSEKPDAPPQQGTGLGLSIVKALVEGHEGRVRVESSLGKGTRFIVTFPAAKEPV
ncbi:MAG: HAMP domain-containing histidine kinase [Elusimicrobia bacterium]|nr:HAMP domain-containing histidine kinase [Elusimicrobiota bacterium]